MGEGADDLTAGLSPSREATADELDRARTLLTELAAAEKPSAVASLRPLSVAVARAAGELVTETTGRAASQAFGPFVDRIGRPAWIDVFPLVETVGVARPGSAPMLFVSVGIGLPPSDTLTLGAGTVWCAARAFSPLAPDGWCGLRIKGGTVRFGSTVSLIDSPIIVAPFATVSVELELDPPAPPGGAGPGEDARRAELSLPPSVVIEFAPGGATVARADAGSTKVYGQSLRLALGGGAPYYDGVLGRIAIPFTADAGTFQVSECASSLVTVTGSAPIAAAAWSLAITAGDPTSLGAAAGDGGFALVLESGVTVARDGAATTAGGDATTILVEPADIALTIPSARTTNVPERIALWDATAQRAGRGELEVRFHAPYPLHYVAEVAGAEAVALVTAMSARLDPPRTINDERIPTDPPAGIIASIQTSAGTFLLVEAGIPEAAGTDQALALKNALILTRGPIGFVAFGAYANAAVARGAVAVEFVMRFVLPTLPDPYASNIAFRRRQLAARVASGQMTVLVEWQPAQAPTVDIVLPGTSAAVASPTARAELANAISEVMARAQAAAIDTEAAQPTAAAGSPARLEAAVVDPDAQAFVGLQKRFASIAGGGIDLFALLDVSTNVSQFGVAYAPARGGTLGVADLYLEATGTGVRVWTLPAVQWEPVLTLPGDDPNDPSFPSPLTYGDCGGPTELATQTVALVPIAPRPAIDGMLAGYNRVTEPAPVAIRFTLPFGIVAVAEIRRSTLLEFPSPSLSEASPGFGADGLSGADQLSIQAAGPLLSLGDQESPSLPGAAWQLHNARFSGVPSTTTVLTPIDDTFNANFGPATKDPRVPVTRLDVSGFGETLFSDWRNPRDAAAIISKAQFDVLVGRTSFEVIQARSVLYPYGVRVVRTITIERRNSAVITRKDSGWKPVTDGTYQFPVADLVTHPGVVRGVSGVVNVRDTGDRHTTPDGSELMAVYFDCTVQIEGVVAGGGPEGVPSAGQRGFVQLTDPPGNRQLAPDQYAELLSAVGPLGGPVDCIVDIGGLGQRMRIHRVDVAATPGMGGPEFAIAAWGSVVLPGGGQWSFARQTSPGDAPEPVDTDRGVPLVRAGPATAPPPPVNPYRLADPGDLLVPDAPAADYGLLHATGTQRTYFPRPKIEAAGPGAITSTRAPVLADPYMLSTAVGLFPRVDASLPFPDASYRLAIGAGGNFTLELSSPSFTVPPTERVLADANAVRSVVHYADENGDPSVVTVAIDTAAAVPWSVTITNLSHATETARMGEVIRTVGTLTASAGAPTSVADSRLVFGPPLKPVQALISFLEVFGPLPPPTLGMTNEWTLQAGLKIDFVKLLESYVPATKAFLEKFIEDLDFVFSAKFSANETQSVTQFEITLKFPTPFPPIIAVGLAKIQFLVSTSVGTAWTILIGFGAGISADIGIGDLTAYYASTEFLITGDTVFGLGAGMLLKGTIDLHIVEVDVSIEAKLALINVTCNSGADSTIWGVAQVTVAVEITIAWVIDIEVDYQTEWDANYDGGPCDLPDVV